MKVHCLHTSSQADRFLCLLTSFLLFADEKISSVCEDGAVSLDAGEGQRVRGYWTKIFGASIESPAQRSGGDGRGGVAGAWRPRWGGPIQAPGPRTSQRTRARWTSRQHGAGEDREGATRQPSAPGCRGCQTCRKDREAERRQFPDQTRRRSQAMGYKAAVHARARRGRCELVSLTFRVCTSKVLACARMCAHRAKVRHAR